MNSGELFAAVDKLNNEYIDFWNRICMMETPTSDKKRIDALGSFLKAKAVDYGWEIEEHVEDTAGNALCFTMNPAAPGAPVCFSAHMDTVYPVGSFGETPVRMDGNRICGPGVTDCKGGIAAAFLAMHALQDMGFSVRPVKLILQSDEEMNSRPSSKRTVDFMIRMAKGCAAFLNLETHSVLGYQNTGTEKNEGPAVLIRKGILTYRFYVRGKAAHSARCMEGVSAVAEAAHKILELEKMKSDRGLTCSCGLIEGGTGINVVPETCTFSADIRFLTSGQKHEAEESVRRIAEKQYVPGSECRVELLGSRCAMEYSRRNEELLEKMNEIYRREGMPILHSAMSSGGSDAADISAAGIPTVDSIGVCGEFIHSLKERAQLDSLAACAKRVAVIALEL